MERRTQGPDWEVVQTYYNLGHTRQECMVRFGFSKRAWAEAVSRGDLHPRAPGTPAVRRTRDAVKRGLAEGKCQAEIARELGLRKSIVAYHARGLGHAPNEKFNRRYDWEAVQRAHDSGMRAHECMRRFGFSSASWSSAVKRGDIVPRSHLIPIEELLVRDRRTGRSSEAEVVQRRTQREALRAMRFDGVARQTGRDATSSQEWRREGQSTRESAGPVSELPCPNRELERQEQAPAPGR